jgi:hypothetical protein
MKYILALLAKIDPSFFTLSNVLLVSFLVIIISICCLLFRLKFIKYKDFEAHFFEQQKKTLSDKSGNNK